jgi:hypothetical protein
MALSTLAQIAAVLGGLLVVAYILKLRRRRYEVPFSKLWQRVLKDKQSSSLWHRLKRLLSLLVQLLFLGLLVFAALDPRLGGASKAARNVVIIIDASASMKAQDDGGDKPARIDQAKLEAKKVLAAMGGADVAMILRMDGQTTALSRFDADAARLGHLVDQITASDTPADLPRALQAAADALRGRPHPLVIIIGDGAYRDEQKNEVIWAAPPALPTADGTATGTPLVDRTLLGKVDLSGIDVAFVPVGKQARNIGIVSFNVRRYFQNKMSYEVLVEVENFGDEPESVKFTLESAGNAIDVKTIDLKPHERVRRIYPDLGGGDDRSLTARIEPTKGQDGQLKPHDAFPVDDVAYALLPERKRQRVLIVTADNLYLEGALLLDPNITADKLRPAEYPAALSDGRVHVYDVAIFDDYTPDKLPPVPAVIYFNPTGPQSPVAVRGEVKRPFVTDTDKDHPVSRWVTLSDVNIDAANVLTPDAGDTVLARSIRDPLIVAGKREGKKIVAFGFSLAGTDLMLRVAFPVLMINSLDWFAGDESELITTYRTGQVWHIPVDTETQVRTIEVRDPLLRSVKAPVIDGRAEMYGRTAGLYRVTAGVETFQVAANLADPFESSIAPARELVLGGKTLAGAPEFAPSVSRQIWIWLCLAALALTLVEWLTYNRRITV